MKQVVHFSGHDTHAPFKSSKPELHDVHWVIFVDKHVAHLMRQLLHEVPTGTNPPRQIVQPVEVQVKQFLEQDSHLLLALLKNLPGKHVLQAVALPEQVTQA